MSIDMITDQKEFMIAGEQTTDSYNSDQFNLYLNLIREEMSELEDAVEDQNKVKILDGLMDILVVTLGASHSLGVPVHAAWNEVYSSNMSKVDSTTGKILKREDGKILKPATYRKPDFEQFFPNSKEKTTENKSWAQFILKFFDIFTI